MAVSLSARRGRMRRPTPHRQEVVADGVRGNDGERLWRSRSRASAPGQVCSSADGFVMSLTALMLMPAGRSSVCRRGGATTGGLQRSRDGANQLSSGSHALVDELKPPTKFTRRLFASCVEVPRANST